MLVESAVEQYEAALPYKDMIVGIGLDSDEYDRPPSLFHDLFRRARNDGFQVTAHCDFNQKDTHEHILQVATLLGGNGADRIDHGLNAADRDELIDAIKAKGMGMTICPCAYIRHTAIEYVFPRIRKLFDAGIKISIASDDPAYMEDNWLLQNLHMVRDKCNFAEGDMLQLQKNAIETCWASSALKNEISVELEKFREAYRGALYS
jgi:adenosine deaminase